VKSDSRIREELMLHGATGTQATQYVGLLRLFESKSKDSGELHHVLPVDCGWWKRYKKCRWNQARIEWEFHLALHGLLVKIFPNNDSLGNALQIIATRKRRDPKGLLKNKSKIVE